MKPFKSITAVILLFFCTTAFAQDNMEDVLYLKNGNVYRGTLIETVPNETYKIQIAGGSIFTVTVAEVQKITKEPRYRSAPPAQANPRAQAPDPRMERSRHQSKYDSTYVPGFKKKRKYFFVGELRAAPNNGGVRIVNGYKFGRFGYLGIGVGIDGASFSQGRNLDPNMNYNYRNYSDGVYLPIYIRYAGDILKKQITPFYYVEMGYAAHPDGIYFPGGGGQGVSRGGPIAAVGFGCKFNTKKRVNFNVNLNANWRSNFYRDTYTAYDPYTGSYYTYDDNGMDGQLFGSVGFGIGF
jgi:hypothetical protein